MKKLSLIVVIIFLLGIWVSQASAANIHLHYFESADVNLKDDVFQVYSFSGLENETVSIVAYALEDGVQPTLSLFDPLGSVITETLNEDGAPIAFVETTIAENGVYTFIVSRTGETPGAVRVMLFEGEPLNGDITLRDTVSPFLPSRAFIVEGGDAPNPVDVKSLPLEEGGEQPFIYVARGTNEKVPDNEERNTPVEAASFTNDEGDTFYTFNVSAVPDGFSALRNAFSQVAPDSEYTIEVGEGGAEEESVERFICTTTVSTNADTYTGPDSNEYTSTGNITGGATVEITGTNGDYVLIIDPNGEAVWILSSNVDASVLGSDDCGRVQLVTTFPGDDGEGGGTAGRNNEGNEEEADGTNGGGVVGNNPLGGLPPASSPPNDAPPPDNPGGGISNPPPPDPNLIVVEVEVVDPDTGEVTTETVIVGSVTADCDADGDLSIIWSNLNAGSSNISYNYGTGPGGFVAPSADGSSVVASEFVGSSVDITVDDPNLVTNVPVNCE